jgi:hypothetical protein
MSGQLNLETEIGRFLYQLMRRDTNIDCVLDVGTWNGLGATLTTVLGCLSREVYKPCIIYSLDAYPEMHEIAKQNWNSRPGGDWITFMYGKISTKMMSKEQIESHPLFPNVKNHYDYYYEKDVKYFDQAPLLGLQGKFDLIILDGGEFCGDSDFDAIISFQPRYILLDDINVLKNINSVRRAIENGYELIFKSDEKSGSAVLRK